MEMYAGKVHKQAEKKWETFGISKTTQQNIVFVLKNANPQGFNYIQQLAPFLYNFQEKFKNDAKYTAFFKDIDRATSGNVYKDQIQQDATQSANKVSKKTGNTFFKDVTRVIDGELDKSDLFNAHS